MRRGRLEQVRRAPQPPATARTSLGSRKHRRTPCPGRRRPSGHLRDPTLLRAGRELCRHEGPRRS
jgi:hypothetical protein